MLLLRDAVATLGETARAEVLAVAATALDMSRLQVEQGAAWDFWDEREGSRLEQAQRLYARSVVEQFQQAVHDLHWDTTWPTCPWHPNHPLWYEHEREAWCCPRRGVVARLGDLASVRPPAP